MHTGCTAGNVPRRPAESFTARPRQAEDNRARSAGVDGLIWWVCDGVSGVRSTLPRKVNLTGCLQRPGSLDYRRRRFSYYSNDPLLTLPSPYR
jgi:hypothetical protein